MEKNIFSFPEDCRQMLEETFQVSLDIALFFSVDQSIDNFRGTVSILPFFHL